MIKMMLYDKDEFIIILTTSDKNYSFDKKVKVCYHELPTAELTTGLFKNKQIINVRDFRLRPSRRPSLVYSNFNLNNSCQ